MNSVRKKKRVRRLQKILHVPLLLCLLVSLLTGCAVQDEIRQKWDKFCDDAVRYIFFGDTGKNGAGGVSGNSGNPFYKEEKEVTEEGADGADEDSGEAEFPEGSFEKLEEDERSYCFSKLNTEQKKIYLEIYNCFLNMDDDTRLSTLDSEAVDMIFNLVMMDHPELFFVDGYRTTETTRDGVPIKLEITGKYNVSKEVRKMKEKEIESAAKAALKDCPTDGSEYDQVRYVFQWIIDHTDYSLDAPDNQNISSVFLNGRSVCQGYSMATKYLLDRLGIFCTVVYGTADGESHSWNLVRMDGTECYVDTTWGDSSYRTEDNELAPQVNYNYFGCNEEILRRTHAINNPVSLPECTALDEYYYVKEGLYFTSADLKRLNAIFEYRQSQEEGNFTIRCADSGVYQELSTELFDDRKIFEILPDSDRVKYIRDDRENTMTFSAED
ncbi:Transglutaminase-like superfamily protein [Lachnospiraceae bacterium]|nr:Transglutaminase-like superfamily protein [Lachnospiraceae bacterium]